MKHTRRFEHAPGSVTIARRFAEDALKGAPAETRDAVLLMVSELASNCIRHTNSGFELTISSSEDEIRVETIDHGGGEPQMRHPGPADPDGRGLQIIDMLSAAWGVNRLASQQKAVWFTVALQAPIPGTSGQEAETVEGHALRTSPALWRAHLTV